MVAVPILLFVAVFAIAIYASARRTKRLRAAWQRAADELRLELSGSGWGRTDLRGQLGGLSIRVDVYSTGDKNKQYWTRYHADFPQTGIAIRLKRQTGLSRITKFFGATDVEIGDQAFDDAFMIKAGSERQAAEYLTMQRRTLLLRLYSLYGQVDLTPDGFEIVTKGYESDPAKLVTVTRRLVSAGRTLAGLHGAEERVERALQQRSVGDMAAAIEALRRAAPPEPDDLEEPLLEVEMLAASGDVAAARPKLDGLAERLPADAEVAGLQRALDRITPTAAAPDQRRVEMQELLDDLFVSNRLSFETMEIFDEHYLGRPVNWKGRLKSARDYTNDLDFGRGPGTKLVIAIAEVEHDLYGVSAVDAVVSVPAGTAKDIARGDIVGFTGYLLKADSMMRNIFVRDGELD
jgi:hypothetical protein